MTMRPKDIQDSVKLALDAADAATDVTAEFSKIKNSNKSLEENVKKIHRATTIIFFSAVTGMLVASVFAALIYFRTMSDLKSITTTSREALVVFAENVNQVNNTLNSLETALKTQESLVAQNNQLIVELQTLNEGITLTRDSIVASMKTTTDAVQASNKSMTNTVSKSISTELDSQNKKLLAQIKSMETKTIEGITAMASGMDDGRQLKAIYSRQGELLELLNAMVRQNMAIVEQIEESKNSIKYP